SFHRSGGGYFDNRPSGCRTSISSAFSTSANVGSSICGYGRVSRFDTSAASSLDRTPTRRLRLSRKLLERVRAVPGMSAALLALSDSSMVESAVGGVLGGHHERVFEAVQADDGCGSANSGQQRNPEERQHHRDDVSHPDAAHPEVD